MVWQDGHGICLTFELKLDVRLCKRQAEHGEQDESNHDALQTIGDSRSIEEDFGHRTVNFGSQSGLRRSESCAFVR